MTKNSFLAEVTFNGMFQTYFIVTLTSEVLITVQKNLFELILEVIPKCPKFLKFENEKKSCFLFLLPVLHLTTDGFKSNW